MKSKLKDKLGAAALAASIGLASCAVVVVQDVSVGWSVEGSTSASLCSDYGIAYFTVEMVGPDRDALTIDCGAAWEANFIDMEEGVYDISVAAWDANDTLIAELTKLDVFIDGDLPPPVLIDFEFLDSDLTSNVTPGDAKIDVLWNINGTVDGSDKGQSWDTCAEVGAAEAVVSVDGVPQAFSCSAGGNMATTLTGLNAGQSYALKIKLVDAASTDLTTEVSATVTATVEGGLFIGDFYYDSFYEPLKSTTDGQYHFQTTYDTLKCSETTPQVDFQVTLIRTEDNTAVTSVQICDLGDTGCYEADGADAKPCTDLEQVLSLLPWGSYKLKLEGGSGTASLLDICWSTEQNILIGAGTDNPLVDIDVVGINGASCFQ